MSGEVPPTSEIEIIKERFEWSVPRSAFDTPVGSEECIQSKEFQATPDSEVFWQLELYPRGDCDETSTDVVFNLTAWNIMDPFEIKYKLGLLGSDGTEAKTACHVARSSKTTPSSGLLWVGTALLIWRNMLSDYTKHDQLTFFCDLEAHVPKESPESSLSHDWSALLDSGDFSDVVLVVGGEEIKAHKLVLSARSHVFAAMFKYNMVENQTGRVEIPDLDVDVVKALLTFLYSEKVANLNAIAEKLLPAADKYGIERLKMMCEKEICKSLIFWNVLDMLSFAELHKANQLKVQALRYINLNSAKVAEQDSYWELANTNPNLLREAFGFSTLWGEQNSDGPQVQRKKLN